jgi:twitching motility protein PilT
VVTPGIANLIRENKTFRINSAIQTGMKFGMQLMDDHLFKLWKEEKVTIEDILAKSASPDELAKRIVNHQRGVMEDPMAGTGEDLNAPPKKPPGGH